MTARREAVRPGLAMHALTCLLASLLPLVAVAQTTSGAGLDKRQLVGEPAGRPLSGLELDQSARDIASIMRCPVCQGLSVADSPTPLAVAMQREVGEMLSQGYTRQQILDYFVQSYGEFVLLEPKPEGLNLVVWVAPVLALLGGFLIIVLRLRRQRPAVAAATPRPDDTDLDGYRERVRRELEQ